MCYFQWPEGLKKVEHVKIVMDKHGLFLATFMRCQGVVMPISFIHDLNETRGRMSDRKEEEDM